MHQDAGFALLFGLIVGLVALWATAIGGSIDALGYGGLYFVRVRARRCEPTRDGRSNVTRSVNRVVARQLWGACPPLGLISDKARRSTPAAALAQRMTGPMSGIRISQFSVSVKNAKKVNRVD